MTLVQIPVMNDENWFAHRGTSLLAGGGGEEKCFGFIELNITVLLAGPFQSF